MIRVGAAVGDVDDVLVAGIDTSSEQPSGMNARIGIRAAIGVPGRALT